MGDGSMDEAVSLSRTLRMHTSPALPLPLPRSSSAPCTDARAPPAALPLAEIILAARLPVGVTREMADWFLVSAERAGEKLVNEAKTSLPWPEQLRDEPQVAKEKKKSETKTKTNRTVLFLARDDGLNVFEYTTRAPVEAPVSLSRSLWSRLRPSRRPTNASQSASLANKPTPRVFATTHVYAPLEGIVALLDHHSVGASALVHPNASLQLHIHTLLERGHEHACLRTVATAVTETASTQREPRDFLLVEYRNLFQLPTTARRGFVVAFHSVSWSGSPSATQPEAVRGSAYTSGLVALESDTAPGRLDLYSVAEFHLKGTATVRDNAEFARTRVQRTLAQLMATLDAHATAALALDPENVFAIALRTLVHRPQGACATCKRAVTNPRDSDRNGRGRSNRGSGGPQLQPCRKCYTTVCSDCSSLWRFGRLELRLCIGCWHGANTAIQAGGETVASEH